jgi:hypothetical protein
MAFLIVLLFNFSNLNVLFLGTRRGLAGLTVASRHLVVFLSKQTPLHEVASELSEGPLIISFSLADIFEEFLGTLFLLNISLILPKFNIIK